MADCITVESLESAPDGDEVHHFDQLSESAQNCLVRLVDDEPTGGVDSDLVAALAEYDCIKFTCYLRVTLSGHSTGSPAVV